MSIPNAISADTVRCTSSPLEIPVSVEEPFANPANNTARCDRDLSAGGAKVKVDGNFKRGAVVSLALGNFGSFSADIMWVEKSLVGLNFHSSPEEMADAIMAIAMHA